jgi:hypothetical protein
VSEDWKRVAREAWCAPSWREAAVKHREDQAGRPAAEIEPGRLRRLRRLMAADVSLDRAWHELRDNRPAPEVTINAIKLAVRARGAKALQEPVNQERLRRCDSTAREQIDQWLANFQKGNFDGL